MRAGIRTCVATHTHVGMCRYVCRHAHTCRHSGGYVCRCRHVRASMCVCRHVCVCLCVLFGVLSQKLMPRVNGLSSFQAGAYHARPGRVERSEGPASCFSPHQGGGGQLGRRPQAPSRRECLHPQGTLQERTWVGPSAFLSLLRPPCDFFLLRRSVTLCVLYVLHTSPPWDKSHLVFNSFYKSVEKAFFHPLVCLFNLHLRIKSG